jgi:hypothetical protein
MGDVGVARLTDGPTLTLGDDHRGVHQPAQLALGLRARQPVGVAGGPLEADLALDARAAGPPGAVPAGAAAAVDDDVEAPCSVGPLGHAGHCSGELGCGGPANSNPIGTLGPPRAARDGAATTAESAAGAGPEYTKGPADGALRAVDGGAVTIVAGE